MDSTSSGIRSSAFFARDNANTQRAELESAMRLLCPDWPLADIRVEEYLSGGYRNRNYRLSYGDNQYVLRIAALPSAMDFTLERTRLEALAHVFPQSNSALELDIAPVVATHVPKGLLLTQWRSAPLLADTAGVAAETLGNYLALLHKTVADLPTACIRPNAIKNASPYPGPKAHIHNDLVTASGSDAVATRLLNRLPEPAHELAVCHLDLNPWNLLTESETWITLDWETLCEADPLFDLVALSDGYLRAQDSNHAKEEFSETVLQAYKLGIGDSTMPPTVDSLTVAAIAQARIVYQWREYAWAAAQLAQGNLRDEIIEQRNYFSGLLREHGFDVLPA